MRVFLDSSALAKRYVEETGSARVLELCRGADEIILSVLCAPGLIAAFNRLRREGKLSSAGYRRLKNDLAADLEQATIIELGPSVVYRTVSCLEHASMRTLDAIQVASALESLCDIFITADRRQSEAATRLKLRSEIIGSEN